MPRKTTAQLLAEIQAQFPDNSTELIQPANVRTVLSDICDSFTPAFGALRGQGNFPVALTTSFVKLNVFDEVVATSPELVASAVNNQIIAVPVDAFFFTATFSLAGANNSDVELALYRDGVPTFYYALSTTTGAANRVEIVLSGYVVNSASSQVYEMYGRVLTGSDVVTFSRNLLTLNTVQR